jgi:hypothetical protein
LKKRKISELLAFLSLRNCENDATHHHLEVGDITSLVGITQSIIMDQDDSTELAVDDII